ncbi:mammalian cell entry protein [Mangrovimonas yunxiaonensis]|uniref:Mammalian cell entry protein n=1 Tax=Mangrovimonas yunxiaonensis TaxID=1197477 RepID=A0A084THK3_9FLAO|nr:MlaD family protein [Mangrovimonas yunxiaonensis]KFB00189.1 mammalian cell entry protein [Mangrovimonas yunxiaonensis]GGH42423.1 organic solvent ABC transporter substrate-binding protein [Mangrovimonas yunxiaonensis]
MKVSREIKTAILVILGIVLFIFGFNYLKGKDLFETSNTFYTEFEYNALSSSSPITIKGNNVGKIKDIVYDFKTGKTRVSFTVDDKLKFSKNSRIRLYELGLLGENGMAIIPADDGAPFAKDGDILQSEVEEGLIKSLSSNFSGLSSGLDNTLRSADSLLININTLVEDDTETGLKYAIKELNATLTSFKSLSYSVNTLVKKNDDSLTALISNFNTISKDLAVLSNDLKTVEISKTVKNLDDTLNSLNTVLAAIEDGQGTMGKLMKDDKLYHNLEVASMQLKDLLQDVKLNPKRYINVSVFGGKNKEGYTKPQDERQ